MSDTTRPTVVTGAQGMLAADVIACLQESRGFVQLFDRSPGTVRGQPVAALDITDAAHVRETITRIDPEWVINCAAFTDVDGAEDAATEAFAVNAEGPAHIAAALQPLSGTLLHVSTDYVFGGSDGRSERRTPYRHDDAPDPCGVYGKSKYQGEQAIREALPERHMIIRTSWLHGVHGGNFLHTMLRLGAERDALRIVDDQVGCPTWSGYLARTMLALRERDERGTFHACSNEGITWLDFAREIFLQANMSVQLEGQSTEELNRRAPRPRFSALATDRLESVLGRKSPSCQEGIREHLARLEEEKQT